MKAPGFGTLSFKLPPQQSLAILTTYINQEKFRRKNCGENTSGQNFQYFGQIFNSKNWIFLMKTTWDWVNLAYKISSQKGKATDWISKSSKKTLKQVNIRYSTYKLQSIMTDNVNQFKHNSKLFIVSSVCLTFRHQDQQRDLLMVVPSSTHLWFQPLRSSSWWCLNYSSNDRKGLTIIWLESV